MQSHDRERAFEEWKADALQSEILQEAIARGAKLKRVGREFVGPCPACGGRDRFSINVQKKIFNCRGAVGGDVIQLVEHLEGCSFLVACQRLTGLPPPGGQQREMTAEELVAYGRRKAAAERADARREREETARRARRAATAVGVWDACRPISGTLAERYLHGRGLETPAAGWPASLGFHQALEWEPGIKRGEDGRLAPGPKMPALVARVQDVGGETIAVHQIYLGSDAKKARVEPNKVTRGPFVGGAIRLGPASERVNLTEGLETGLAVHALLMWREPVWSCLGTAGLAAIELALVVRRLRVWPDGDRPIRKHGEEYLPERQGAGMKAASALKERMDAMKIACVLAAEPPRGQDYLDLYLAARKHG